MFNINYSGVLPLLILVYFAQTWVVFLLLSTTSSSFKFLTSNLNTQLNNKSINFFMYCIIFFFAGVPPFFMFFIKILVFLKFSDSNLVFIALFLLNTIILSYYLNFVYKITESRKFYYSNVKATTQIKIRSSFLHTLFFNTVSIFIIHTAYFL